MLMSSESSWNMVLGFLSGWRRVVYFLRQKAWVWWSNQVTTLSVGSCLKSGCKCRNLEAGSLSSETALFSSGKRAGFAVTRVCILTPNKAMYRAGGSFSFLCPSLLICKTETLVRTLEGQLTLKLKAPLAQAPRETGSCVISFNPYKILWSYEPHFTDEITKAVQHCQGLEQSRPAVDSAHI